jgi:hypothetical protein
MTLSRHEASDLVDVGVPSRVEQIEQFEEAPYSFCAAGLANVTRPWMSVATTASDT